MKKFFKINELKLNELQYMITHDFTLNFNVGDIVFLKSNPEIPLKVFDIDMDFVYCKNKNKFSKHKPQMLLHYKYASLLKYKKEWNITLN